MSTIPNKIRYCAYWIKKIKHKNVTDYTSVAYISCFSLFSYQEISRLSNSRREHLLMNSVTFKKVHSNLFCASGSTVVVKIQVYLSFRVKFIFCQNWVTQLGHLKVLLALTE